MMDGCPRLKMGYESCDAPLCGCPRAARTLSISLDQEGLVEKVARAICKADGSHWFASDHCKDGNNRWLPLARAALLAIRQGDHS